MNSLTAGYFVISVIFQTEIFRIHWVSCCLQKIIPLIIKRCGIDPEKKVNQITREERERLVSTVKKLTFTVKCMRPVEEAIITRGGVDVSQIDPRSMESKLCKGLYFIGEVLDVDAYTGGLICR